LGDDGSGFRQLASCHNLLVEQAKALVIAGGKDRYL